MGKTPGILSSSAGRYACIAGCGARVSHKQRRCQSCYLVNLHQATAAAAQRRRERAPALLYACLGECGQMLRVRDSYCSACKHNRQADAALRSEQSMRTHLREINAETNRTVRPMIKVDGETYSLGCDCKKCGAAILTPSRCYTCATGQERTSIRAKVVYSKTEPVPVVAELVTS